MVAQAQNNLGVQGCALDRQECLNYTSLASARRIQRDLGKRPISCTETGPPTRSSDTGTAKRAWLAALCTPLWAKVYYQPVGSLGR